MDKENKRSVSVYLIALAVILANLIVFSVIYQVPFLSQTPAIKKALPLISLAAVYPYEVFQHYLREDLAIHTFWIFSLLLSSLGLLIFNRFARVAFIAFNIIHFVVLGVVSFFYFGQYAFWGYFFKCYFNMVVFLLYVGYLTLPEIRQQFVWPAKEKEQEPWLLKLQKKTLGPKDATGYFNLALAYKKLGRMDECVDYLTRAIAIVPTQAEYRFSLGQILFDRLDYFNAIKHLNEAVRLDAIHARARYLLGLAYQRTGCLEEAVRSFRRCAFLEPLKGDVYRHLGIVCYHIGYLQEAEQAFRKGAELDPLDFYCPYYLGLIMTKDRSRMKNAEEQLKKCVRINPDFSDGFRELGNFYVASGDYRGAVRAFRDVLRLSPDLTQAHYQLGFAYAMLKDFESARREHKILKDLDPDLAQTLGMLLSRS